MVDNPTLAVGSRYDGEASEVDGTVPHRSPTRIRVKEDPWKWTKSWWTGVVWSVYFGNQIRAIFCGWEKTGASIILCIVSVMLGQCPASWKA
jgi:hypothetical protein